MRGLAHLLGKQDCYNERRFPECRRLPGLVFPVAQGLLGPGFWSPMAASLVSHWHGQIVHRRNRTRGLFERYENNAGSKPQDQCSLSNDLVDSSSAKNLFAGVKDGSLTGCWCPRLA
jgi:hypothetical protein